MRRQLKLHPDSRSVAVASIDVDIACPRTGRLELAYIVTGQMSKIRMPPAAASARSDGLWRHTCCEAFIRVATGYYELNFSPSGQWAAYAFSSYRNGMRVADEISGIPIEPRSSPDGFTLQASLDLDRLPGMPHELSWRLGLSVVVEDTNGGMSYWSLAHPPGKPDFHHPDGFTCEFSPVAKS